MGINVFVNSVVYSGRSSETRTKSLFERAVRLTEIVHEL